MATAKTAARTVQAVQEWRVFIGRTSVMTVGISRFAVEKPVLGLCCGVCILQDRAIAFNRDITTDHAGELQFCHGLRHSFGLR
mgnify:CR=1 FL=1